MKTSMNLLAAAAFAACLAGTALAAPVAVTGDIHSVANAFAVDPSAFDLGADPDIDDATTIPHASLVNLAAGPFDYFKLDLSNRGALTLDIDYSDGWDHAGLGLDLQLAVWKPDGTLLALDDDDPRPWGFPGPSADPGSFSTLDPYIRLDGLAAGSYIVGVAYAGAQADASGWLAGGEIPAGGMYELNVSLAAVPEPAGALPWLAGAGALLASLRRRRAR